MGELRIHMREGVRKPIRAIDPKTVNENAERFFRRVMSEGIVPLSLNPGGGIPGNHEVKINGKRTTFLR